ncbi:hypothetical protein BJX70DRAFT_395252 [Aspergillus crustosus]
MNLSTKGKDAILENLIDAMLWSQHSPEIILGNIILQKVGSDYQWRYTDHLGRHGSWVQSIEETFFTALIASAIIRDDVAEFQRLLDQDPESAISEIVKSFLFWRTGDTRYLWKIQQRPYFSVYRTGRWKGPLSWLLQNTHTHMVKNRIVFTRMFLDYGFDVDDYCPGIPGNLFRWAVKIQDFEMAKLLLEYGADVNVNVDVSARQRCKNKHFAKEKYLSPLALALDRRRVILKLLLDHGASRTWWWQGQEHVLGTTPKVYRNIERLFQEVGFDEQEVGELDFECYVVVNPG